MLSGFITNYRYTKNLKAIVICLFLISSILVCSFSLYFKIQPQLALTQILRIMAVNIVSKIHTDELDDAKILEKKFLFGNFNTRASSPEDSWKTLNINQNHLVIKSYTGLTRTYLEVPFIFEDYNAEYLKNIRDYYPIENLVIAADTEYEAILKVASWVGKLWDHGIDIPLEGSQNFNAIDAIEAAKNGARYWCEISARTMSQIASALGWPSRVITLSKEGYHWHHAVTEVWSNQFSKWFVIDTDFNVIYESNGIPLSAYELIHDGITLNQLGKLKIKQIAPLKPFFISRKGKIRELKALEKLSFYNYAHVDMRNDWVSRKLSRGSPAGGDRATYFTSNKTIPRILNALRRAKKKSYFDWPVNMVEIHLIGWSAQYQTVELEIELKGYGPYAEYIEIKLDSETWRKVKPRPNFLQVSDGTHKLQARLVLNNNKKGPISSVIFNTRSLKESGLRSRIQENHSTQLYRYARSF